MFSPSLSTDLGVQLLSHMVTPCLTSSGISNCVFPSGCAVLHSYQQVSKLLLTTTTKIYEKLTTLTAAHSSATMELTQHMQNKIQAKPL